MRNVLYSNSNIETSIDRVILTAHNKDTKIINNKLLELLNEKIHTYYSLYYATHKVVGQTDENINLNYPVVMLNNIKEGLLN